MGNAHAEDVACHGQDDGRFMIAQLRVDVGQAAEGADRGVHFVVSRAQIPTHDPAVKSLYFLPWSSKTKRPSDRATCTPSGGPARATYRRSRSATSMTTLPAPAGPAGASLNLAGYRPCRDPRPAVRRN